MITDIDFADDIVLLSDQIKQAQELLNRVEKECKNVGLGINAKKTKLMADVELLQIRRFMVRFHR